jgi:3-hydroxyisobutyrate dehydrogenase-like beta-hydroxyacid dehydrogenase
MPRKSRKNVGLIGLGIIGSRVANALRAGGYHVYVWNRTPRAAPNFLPSPRQVAELCDVIQLFVSDAHALFDVIETMGDALTPSHTIVCNATVGPEAVIEAARLVQQHGAQFLDAPVAGSKAAAEKRELVYYIGGDDKALQAVESVLNASSKAIVKIGKIGDASLLKVATSMLAAVTVQTLAEAYAIIQDSGVDPRALTEALKHHGVHSSLCDDKLAKMLERDFEPHFSLKQMFKDVQLGIHIANSLDIDLPATTATAGVLYGGLTRGWADQDFAVLARAYDKDDQTPPSEPEGTAPSGQNLPAATPPAPDQPGESTPGQSRDTGIKLPDAPAQPASEKNPSPEPTPEAPKPEPAKSESQKVDAAPEEGANTSKSSVDGNGAPVEPTREHTPFVRIRRWFGSGAPN